jgi:hypothetical protein
MPTAWFKPGDTMKIYSRRTATLFYGMAILTACATQTPLTIATPPSGSLGVISEQEIGSSRGTNAYEVVERIRPLYLTSQLDLMPDAERQVYLNGVRLGGLNELRMIPAREVKEIRFVRAIDGGVYGVGRSGGAIYVTSRPGR